MVEHLIGKIFTYAGAPQGVIFVSLLLLIYINNLAVSPNSIVFFYDSSLFSVVRDLNTSANEINEDWKKGFPMENEFNLDLLKEAYMYFSKMIYHSFT